MQSFAFTLRFALPGESVDSREMVRHLRRVGCMDAVPVEGKRGRLAFAFQREARSAEDAMLDATRQVWRAIPGAWLVEALPDLVGLSEAAGQLGWSRQALRKRSLADPTFPPAVHEGHPELFHLVDILDWIRRRRLGPVVRELAQVAAAARALNVARQVRRLPKLRIDKRFRGVPVL